MRKKVWKFNENVAAAFLFKGKEIKKEEGGRRKADGSKIDKTGRVWYNGQTDELLDKTEISVYADGSAPDGRKQKIKEED